MKKKLAKILGLYTKEDLWNERYNAWYGAIDEIAEAMKSLKVRSSKMDTIMRTVEGMKIPDKFRTNFYRTPYYMKDLRHSMVEHIKKNNELG